MKTFTKENLVCGFEMEIFLNSNKITNILTFLENIKYKNMLLLTIMVNLTCIVNMRIDIFHYNNRIIPTYHKTPSTKKTSVIKIIGA